MLYFDSLELGRFSWIIWKNVPGAVQIFGKNGCLRPMDWPEVLRNSLYFLCLCCWKRLGRNQP